MSLLRHIRTCTDYDPGKFEPFSLGAKQVGWVLHEVREALLETKLPFVETSGGLALDPALTTYEARTHALAQAADFLAQRRQYPLRKEMYPVLADWDEKPLAELDRSALPWFGVRGYGVHANGFVRRADGLYLWIAERAEGRLIDPGKLDNLVGGGMSVGYSPEETLVKEGWEEAGIPATMVRSAHPAGALHYKLELMGGLRNDTLFIYDLELPETFIPRNTDGEVGAFMLKPFAEIASLVEDTDRFKFNCNLVIIDFLIRHDLIDTAHPEHAALVAALKTIREKR